MEVRTTVRNFVHDMTAYHISSDTRIRVIIDDPHFRRESGLSESFSVPSLTPTDQRQRLNELPREYDPQASVELIAIIDVSHMNTDRLEL